MSDDVLDLYADVSRTIAARKPVSEVADLLIHLWSTRADCVPGSSVKYFQHGQAEFVVDQADGPAAAHDIRTLGAMTFATPPNQPRENYYQRRFPLVTHDNQETDRGHLVSYSAGGLYGPNLFRQDRALNRGRSAEGRQYREMENAAVRANAFFFGALVYGDETDFPVAVELGIVLDQTLQVRRFRNRFDAVSFELFSDAGVM